MGGPDARPVVVLADDDGAIDTGLGLAGLRKGHFAIITLTRR